MARSRSLLLAALSAVAAATHAGAAEGQVIDLASTSAQYMPSAEMAGIPGTVQVSSYDIGANVPLALAPKTFLIPGASYHVDSVSFADTAPEFVELRAFQAFDISSLVVQTLGSGWSIAARTSIGLAGDFEAVDTGLLRANALASATHMFSKRFVLGGGAITTFSFGSFLPLPAIYVDWKPVDGLELEGFLPAFAHARYTLLGRVRFGVLAEFSGNEYAVRDPRVRSAWPCAAAPADDPTTAGDERVARPAECFDNVAYSVGTAGLALGVRLFASVWLTQLVGHSFFRRLDRRNAARDLLPEGRDEVPNVVVVRTALVWRMPGLD